MWLKHTLAITLKMEVECSSQNSSHNSAASLKLSVVGLVSLYNSEAAHLATKTEFLSNFHLNSFEMGGHFIAQPQLREKSCQTGGFAVMEPISSPWRKMSRGMH